jgi:2-alkenal reductase
VTVAYPVPGIGVLGASEGEAARLGVDGVITARTLPNSPAVDAGLEGVDANGQVKDLITAVNGRPVHSMPEFAAAFEDAGVGNKVSLTVARGGQSRTLVVTVADISQLKQD